MVTPENRADTRVLRKRFEVCAAARDSEAALEVARALMSMIPGDLDARVQCAFRLHELKLTQEAYDLLVPALKISADEWVVPYNLACYACQLGDRARSKELLAMA